MREDTLMLRLHLRCNRASPLCNTYPRARVHKYHPLTNPQSKEQKHIEHQLVFKSQYDKMTIFIFFLLFMFPFSSATLKNETLFIKDSLLFEIKNRPYVATQLTILHQPFSLKSLYDALDNHSALAQRFNESCYFIEQKYTDSQGGRKEEKPDQQHRMLYGNKNQDEIILPKYKVVTYHDHTEYQARQMCKEKNMKLPEPITDIEMEELGQFLKENKVNESFIGMIFDIKSMKNLYPTSGKTFQKDAFLKRKMHTNEGKYLDPFMQQDDFNAKYTVNDKGEMTRWSLPSSTPGLDNGLIEKLRYQGKLELSKYLRQTKKPVVCEYKKNPTERKNELIKEELEMLNTYNTCKAAGQILRNTNARIHRKLDKTLEDFGLKKVYREKRQWLQLAAAVLPTLISPSGIVNTYSRLQTANQIRQREKAIQMNSQKIRSQARDLEMIQFEGNKLKREQQNLRWALDKTNEKLHTLEQYKELDQNILSVIATNQHLEIGIIQLISELREFLKDTQNNRIPAKMRSTVQKYIQEKGIRPEAIILRKDNPILIEKTLINDTINIFVTFEEGQDRWDLFEITPMPIYIDGKQYRKQLQYKNILVDKDQQQFAILTEEENTECLQSVCSQGKVRREVLDDKCGIICLVGQKADQKCPTTEEVVEPYFVNTQKGVAYAVPEPVIARASCKDEMDKAGVDKEVSLEQLGILHLPPGCDLIITRPFIKMIGPLSQIIRRNSQISTSNETPSLKKINLDKHQFTGSITHEVKEKLIQTVKNRMNNTIWALIVTLIVVGTLLITLCTLSGWSVIVLVKRWRKIKESTKELKEKLISEIDTFSFMAGYRKPPEQNEIVPEVDADYIEMRAQNMKICSKPTARRSSFRPNMHPVHPQYDSPRLIRPTISALTITAIEEESE